jgi:tetratricopeptide (TPR) repeat protein
VPEPSATPQPQITATATAALTLPKSALLDGIKHQQQTWNNCGPANISMLLNFHGIADTQRDAARFLKPVREDKNVSPQELVAYTESRGLRARWVIGADMTLLKSLIAAGLPVIAESWFIPKPNDEMGHYELIHGYDGDTLIADDSYEGPNQRLLAADWEPLWKVFNYSLIVVWPEARDTEVRTLLGDRMDDVRMAALALDRARQQTAADPDDKFAWFNIGTNLLSLGDAPGATTAFEKADSLKLPWRMLWYQHGPYEANYAVGNFDQVLKLTNRSLKATGDLEESYFWRGKAHLALGKRTEARRDFSIALKLNPNYSAAAEAAQQ